MFVIIEHHAGYIEYLVVRKLHIQNLKLSLTFERQPCIPSALHETHQIAYLNTVANFLVFLPASTLQEPFGALHF
jgi:hypothetical protein